MPIKAEEPTSTPLASGLNKHEVVAKLAGHPVTSDELTSYGILLENFERISPEDRKAVFTQYALGKLIDDVYTTISKARKAEGLSPSKYKSASERNYLKGQFNTKIRNSINVPRSEMEKWYTEHVAQYVTPERIHSFHVFMEVSKDNPSSTTEKVRARMDDVKRQADSGTSIGLLAQRYSEAGNAKDGGDIGMISPRIPLGPESKPMNLALENALFRLQPGHASEVVQTSSGIHLMYAAERETTVTPTLDDLITSQILPGALLSEKMTSRVRELLTDTARKHNAKVLETSGSTNLTTSTVAFEFDGKPFTVQNMEQLYGARFTRFYARAQGNADQLKNLMQQVLDDESYVQAAIDAGEDKKPEVARNLKLLGEHAAAQERLRTIVAEAYPATEAAAKELYEKQKDSFRRPEAQGRIITFLTPQTSSPAERARGTEKARAEAEKTLAKLKKGEDFAALAKQVSQDDLASSGGLVTRHVIGQATTAAGQAFDQGISTLEKPGELSDVRPYGNDFVIVKLEERFPGEAVPFEQLKQRFLTQLQNLNEQKARNDIMDMLNASGKIEWLTENPEEYGGPAKVSK